MTRHPDIDSITPVTSPKRKWFAAAAIASAGLAGVVAVGAVASALSPSTANTTQIASDSFDRTVVSGLGSADQGGAYTTFPGQGVYQVSGGHAVMAGLKAGQSAHAVLASVSALSTEVVDSLTVPDASAAKRGLYFGLDLRWDSAGSGYRGFLSFDSGGHVKLTLVRFSKNSGVTLATTTLPTVTSSGQTLNLRARVTGTAPPILQIKAWVNGTAEPGWQLRYDDSASAAIKTAGSVGTWAYVSSSAAPVAYSQSGFKAWHIGAAAATTNPPPPPVTPTAAPSAANTGVPAGTRLTVYNGDLTITAAGSTYSGLDVRGFVYVRASNVTLKNSIIRGRGASTSIGLVNTKAGSTNFTLTDSELVPQNPSVLIDGFHGASYTATRVNVHGTVDGFKVMGDNVTIQRSYVHDLTRYGSDPYQSGGPSHNDGVQVLGGRHIRITYNTLAIATNLNSAIQIGQNVSAVTDLAFSHNWVNGATCAVNSTYAPLASMSGITVNDNSFGSSTNPACTIVFKPHISYTATGNIMSATGTPARVRVLP